MKLGIVFSGADVKHTFLSRFLKEMDREEIPVAVCGATAPLFSELLAELMQIPPESVTSFRIRKKLRYRKTLQIPLFFCLKDLLSQQTVYFGTLPEMAFSEYSVAYRSCEHVEQLLWFANHRKPFFQRDRIYSNCYLQPRDFFLGLHLSGCNRCLLVNFLRPEQDPKWKFCRFCENRAELTVAMDPDGDLLGEWKQFWQEIRLPLYEFLYFPQNG